MAQITFIIDDGQEVVVSITEAITIGSAEGNDVVVSDEHLSPRHAVLMPLAEDIFEVLDLGSIGGTHVNGHPVTRQRLKSGDQLAFGPLKAVFHHAETLSPAPAIAELTEQHQALQKALASKERELAVCHDREQKAARRLEQLSEQTVVEEKRRAEVRQTLAELEKAALLMQQKLQQDQQQAMAAEKHLQDLSQQAAELEARVQQLRESETGLMEAQQRQQERKQRLEAELHECERRLASTSAELTAKGQRLEATERRLRDLERQCQELSVIEQKLTQSLQQQVSAAPAPRPAAEVAPAAVAPPTIPAARSSPRIVAIESPRSKVIPMKSERIIKKTPMVPPRQAS